MLRLDFEIVEKLQKCLLVSYNSCEKIYLEKDFDIIATEGRHTENHCLLIAQLEYSQSKLLCTIKLSSSPFFCSTFLRTSNKLWRVEDN